MNEEKKPKPPLAGVVYGSIIYWSVLAASVIVMISSVISYVTKADFIEPSYCISLLWQGKSVANIWEGSVGALPRSHWYLSHLGTGDGLATLGLCLGVFSVIPALLGSAIAIFKGKNKLFGLLALIAMTIVIISMLGLTPLPA